MALNIDLDGFGFLESDSDVAKLSPTLNKQPPISPIESESSSGISSLDSDDLKVSNHQEKDFFVFSSLRSLYAEIKREKIKFCLLFKIRFRISRLVLM